MEEKKDEEKDRDRKLLQNHYEHSKTNNTGGATPPVVDSSSAQHPLASFKRKDNGGEKQGSPGSLNSNLLTTNEKIQLNHLAQAKKPALSQPSSPGLLPGGPSPAFPLFPHSPMFVMLGGYYTVQASCETLRKELTDSYWCSHMSDICDGKQVGVAVRYTGENLVFVQFRPEKYCRSGRRYGLSMSIPGNYLVPCPKNKASTNSPASAQQHMGQHSYPHHAQTPPEIHFPDQGIARHHEGNIVEDDIDPGTPLTASPSVLQPGQQSEIAHLCVVCGQWDRPGEVRRHGYKCSECIGKTSKQRLREESERLTLVEEEQSKTFSKLEMQKVNSESAASSRTTSKSFFSE